MSIFSKVRGRTASTQADVNPHQWQLPWVYPTATSDDRDIQIPDPRILRNAFVPNDPSIGTTDASLSYPDISHAAVHLILLECFRKLRLSASGLDLALEKPPDYAEHAEAAQDQLPARLPESERWDLLIRLAITRFTAWWINIDQVFSHFGAYNHYAGDKAPIQLTKDYLPPLDVLLVWYAFILDEHAYQAACHDRNMHQLTQLCFPWPAIRDVISTNTLTFELPRAADKLFSTLSSQSADILSYLSSPPAYTEARRLPIEVDLFAAVKIQQQFIDDAHELLWIRSPALMGSLQRACKDYLKFRLSGPPSPSLEDVYPFGLELIWKTHKLFPLQHRLFREGIGSRIPPLQDTKSPVQTNSQASNTFIPVMRCSCWTCERIRDDIPSFTYNASAASDSDGGTWTAQPYSLRLLLTLSSDQFRSIQDDVGFYRAFENARTRRIPFPTRPLTAAERAAEKAEAKKRADAGILPSFLSEYIEIMPDGTRKVRRVKPLYGLRMSV